MLKLYLEELLEEYLLEIDFCNAISLVRMDVDELLNEIMQKKLVENLLFYYFYLF